MQRRGGEIRTHVCMAVTPNIHSRSAEHPKSTNTDVGKIINLTFIYWSYVPMRTSSLHRTNAIHAMWCQKHLFFDPKTNERRKSRRRHCVRWHFVAAKSRMPQITINNLYVIIIRLIFVPAEINIRLICCDLRRMTMCGCRPKQRQWAINWRWNGDAGTYVHVGVSPLSKLHAYTPNNARKNSPFLSLLSLLSLPLSPGSLSFDAFVLMVENLRQ